MASMLTTTTTTADQRTVTSGARAFMPSSSASAATFAPHGLLAPLKSGPRPPSDAPIASNQASRAAAVHHPLPRPVPLSQFRPQGSQASAPLRASIPSSGWASGLSTHHEQHGDEDSEDTSISSSNSRVSGDDNSDEEEEEEDNGEGRGLANLIKAHTADMQRGRRHVGDLPSEEEGEEGSDEEEAAGEKGDDGSSQSEVYDSAGEEGERTAEEEQMAILVERPIASLMQVGLWLWRVVHWCFF
jgi:hypothetical protein